MNKEKWLLKEIDSWQQSALIDRQTADILRNRYALKKNTNLLIVLFSVIGSILIGSGIILILARNWQHLPMPLRASLAFLPLVVSHALAVFTVRKKYESLAWRESIAILITASVFTVNAMIGQVFHLSADYDTYILACGLLSLPVIYILDAASPLLVYYWTILNWAALNHSPVNALLLLALFVLGASFVFIKHRQTRAGACHPRMMYMMWLTVAAGFALILIMGIILDCSLLLAALCFFILLLSFEELPDQLIAQFKRIGASGSLVIVSILTYERMWYYRESPDNAGNIMIGVMLAAALFFAVRIFKRDKLKFLPVITLIILAVARFIWTASDYGESFNVFIMTGASNLILLLIGAGFIVHGVKNTVLSHTNFGMAAVCALIIMRFFDTDLDFFWRGIVFLVLGIVFLLVNLRIIRVKKRTKQEAQI